MKRIVIGFDPGKTGAIATIINGHVEVCPMPVIPDGNLDITGIKKMILELKVMASSIGEEVFIGIEKQSCRAITRPKSIHTNALNYGKLLGMLEGWISFIEIDPREWKSKILVGLPWKKKKGAKTNVHKKVSIGYVLKKYPNINLFPTENCKVPSHDLADAVCIAEYARLRGGEEAL